MMQSPIRPHAEGPSSDGPPTPVVIRVATGYLVKISLGCLIALAGFGWMIYQGAVTTWLIAVSVCGFGLVSMAAPFAVASLRLELTPAGIFLRSPAGTTFAPWGRALIRLIPAPRHIEISAPDCEVRRWWQSGTRRADGLLRIKGDWFGMTTEGLATLIVRYRERATEKTA